MSYNDKSNEDLVLKNFLDSLPHNAAVLDGEGLIICVNNRWEDFARQNGLNPGECGPGVSYLQVLEKATEKDYEDIEEVKRAISGIQAVISGDKEEYSQEYPCHSPEEKRWFKMGITLFRQGALVLHENITERKKAELEAERQKELLNQTIDGIPDIIGIQRSDLTIKQYNQAGLNKLDKELEDVKGKKCFELIGKEERCENCATVQAKKSKKLEKVEKQIPELNGYFVCISNPIKDDEGNIKFIVEQLRDISKRKENEEELKKRKERLETLFSSSTSAIATLDENNRIRNINDKFKKVFGYKLEEIRGKDLDEVLERGRSGSVDRSLTEQVLTGHKVRKQGTRYDRDGNPRKFIIKDLPIEVLGSVEGIYAIFEDITGLNQVQEELEKKNRELERSEKRFQRMLSVIPDMVSIHDTNMNIVYSNWNGFARVPEDKQKLDTKCYRTYRDRDDICPDCKAKEVLETGEPLLKEVQLSEGGWYDLRVLPIKYEKGEAKYFVEWVRDITDEKKKREKIEDQKERLASIIESTNVGTWEWNVQTGEVNFNEKWAEMIGYTLEELEPITIETWRKFTHPEDLNKSQEKLTKHFRGEKEQYHIEYRMRHKEGHWIWVLDRGRVVTWTNDGRPEWMYGTHLDITERKNRQEKIEYMSYHDELTDLYNRNYLKEKMKDMDVIPELPISIIMADINGLKLINDTYGHEVGDELLIKTAEILRDSTREKDFIARWSGDEFVILLPETDIDEVWKIRNRIEEGCSDVNIDGVPLTLGIGEATKTKFEEDIFDKLHESEDNMHKDKLTRSRSGKNKLVKNLLSTLSAKSDETREHAMRMTAYAHNLGEEVNLPSRQLNNLSLLASLHDIGKVTISEDILKKPGKLSNEEWEIIKQHPERGYIIASASEEFAPIAQEILYHHEKWDGTGYPEGLEGESIPFLSRIITIVDAYDVMTTGRPYQGPMSKDEALKEIIDCAGSQFDPALAKQYVKMMENSP